MMNTQGALQEARQLRTKIQMDSRLRLEVLAALSRTFRENGARVSNDLLRSLVFAVPEELPGEGGSGKTASAGNGSGRSKKYAKSGIPPGPSAIPPRQDPGIPPGPSASMRQKLAASSSGAGAGRLRKSTKKSLKSTKRKGKTK